VTYVNRMCWRMLSPAVLPIGLGSIAAYAAAVVLSVAPGGALAIWADLPWDVFQIGAAGSCVIVCIQAIRLWRWERGAGTLCFVCGCLLGHERVGPYGPYRRCLGCSKGHSAANELL